MRADSRETGHRESLRADAIGVNDLPSLVSPNMKSETMHKVYVRSATFAVVCLALQMNAIRAHSEDLKVLVERLKPISVDETKLRELAGKDGFQPYVLNPVLSPGMRTRGDWDAGALGSASVIKVDGVYHLYYEAWGKLSEAGRHEEYNTLQIGHAVSLDGLHWAKDPANPVLRKGAEGDWDHDGTWDPFVICEDGLFKMWYGGDNNGIGGWGYAVSHDGSQFEKRGRISQPGQVEDGHVVHDRQRGEYRYYYWDRDQAPWDDVMKGPPAPSGLFVATSKNETDFDFGHAQRITVESQAWPVKYSQVLPYKDQWVMFYGQAVTRGNPSSTGMAFSQDGYGWKKAAYPLVAGHDAEVVEAAPGLWLMYYGPNKYFDWPECDLRLAIYAGPLEHLSGKGE
jgi:hypothetical protein